MPPRLFTVEEARALLPQVRALVEQLVERRAEQLAAAARLAELEPSARGNGHVGHDARMRADALARADAALIEPLTELDRLGLVVKDVDAGIVDFPSTRDGEDVLLCWRLGEPELRWWHGPDDGFAGRRPI